MWGFFQIFIFVSLFFLQSCGDLKRVSEDLNIEENPERLLVHYVPELKETARLSTNQAKLYQEMQSDQGVSYERLTEAFVEKHIEVFFESYTGQSDDQRAREILRDEVLRGLKDLVDEIDYKDPHSFKLAWEAKLGEIQIDAEAKNLLDVFAEKKIQAYSGTSAQIILWRLKLNEDEFTKQNFVVIFEQGHLLPGYLSKLDNGWNLYGVEMTTEGPSQVIYGLTKDLKSPIRIVSAEDFILEEVFQDFFLHAKEVKTKLLKRSSQRYGLSMEDCEPKSKMNEVRTFGKTLFCFGHPMLSDGPRKYLDRVEARDFRPKNGLDSGEIRRLFVTQENKFVVD